MRHSVYDETIKPEDIYASILHYKCPLISHVDTKKGKILSVEDLVTEVLKKTREIREIEMLPLILINENFNEADIRDKSAQKDVERKTGYIFDLSLFLVKTLGVSKEYTEKTKKMENVSNYLYSLADNQKELVLLNNISHGSAEKLRNGDSIEKKWNLISCLNYDALKRIMQNNLKYNSTK